MENELKARSDEIVKLVSIGKLLFNYLPRHATFPCPRKTPTHLTIKYIHSPITTTKLPYSSPFSFSLSPQSP